MLEYVKVILKAVSFDAVLFEKELRKNMKDLVKEELQELKRWCYEQYGQVYPQVLSVAFARV